MVGGEYDPATGIPFYRRVVVTVPRQNGKTTLTLAWELQRAIGFAAALGAPQRVVYSAQTGHDARKKFVEDQLPLIEPNAKALGVKQTYRGAGFEGVLWVNGSRLVLMSSGEEAGHGKTVDLGVVDELFADVDERRSQALVPSMKTRPTAQLLMCSTAGTDASVTLNAIMARGRAAVEAGSREGTAYFEWSAPLDADPDDPATWAACNPALGYTITEAVLRDDRANMLDGEFRRADLNQPTRAVDRVLPVAAWDACCRADARPTAPLVFALDVNPERTAASIAVASGGSTPTVELVEHRDGVGWLVDRVADLTAKWASPILVDQSGPAGFIISELEGRGVNVEPLAPRELVSACGAFFDRVIEHRVTVRSHYALDVAAAGATKRSVGDAWAWARKHNTIDVSPLVAATLATWGAARPLRIAGLIDPNDYDDEENGWKT